MPEDIYRTGFVGLVGRPNVGKSTLLNYLVGEKISITSSKPQTTRHRILGINTNSERQIIYVDSPGIQYKNKKALHRYLNRTADSISHDVDVVLFVIEADKWFDDDKRILGKLKNSGIPIILVINKTDLLKSKDRLLPFIQQLQQENTFQHIIPLSALKQDGLKQLENAIIEMLPLMPAFYPEDQVTDRTDLFIATEILREKLMRNLGEEVPYAVSVELEKYEDLDKIIHLYFAIWVERDSQKSIVIGKNGEKLKTIGKEARSDLQELFGKKVNLKTWVRVKSGWSDSEKTLQQLGYRDEF